MSAFFGDKADIRLSAPVLFAGCQQQTHAPAAVKTSYSCRRKFLKIGYQACVDQHAIEAARFGSCAADWLPAHKLTWGILSFFWLALTRRPVISGALSLFMMTVLVLLSQLKYHVLMMTPNFVDLMIVDTDTVSFLFMAVAELMTDGLMQSAVFAADRVEGGGHQLESSRCGPFRYSSA